MNREYMKQLAEEAEAIDPQNEVLWEINFNKRLAELKINLDDTINYLDTCSKQELDWASETFEDLSEYFKSQSLIECVERIITRFPDEELQKQLQMELEYMKHYI